MKKTKEEALEAPVEAPKAKPQGIRVASAFLHQALSWPRFPAERTITEGKFKQLKMALLPQGLLLEATGANNKREQCLIPHTNVANYVLEEKLPIE